MRIGRVIGVSSVIGECREVPVNRGFLESRNGAMGLARRGQNDTSLAASGNLRSTDLVYDRVLWL